MSAETLRRAAAGIREDVACLPERQTVNPLRIKSVALNSRTYLTIDPAVALAVAHWLNDCAQFYTDFPGYSHDGEDYALAVARAYLGEDA